MIIQYAAKQRGDLFTATDANEIKEVVNNNANILYDIATGFTKSVWLTQSEYDALVDAGTVDSDTEYNIYEEE